MRGLAGLTFALAGAVTVLYGAYPEPADRQDALERLAAALVTEPPSSPRRDADLALVVVDPQRRAFSPQAPLFRQVPQGGHDTHVAHDAEAGPSLQPISGLTLPSAAVARSSEAATGSNAIVGDPAARPGTALAERAAAPAIALPLTPDPAVKASGEDAQRDLARNLQQELKRVGCYDGEITGNWTAASRRAMKSFTERVNATLPVDEPDYILLTLVKGHGAEACGARCPAGQLLANNGKCLPRAIVAQAEKKAAKRAQANAIASMPSERAATASAAVRSPTTKSADVGRALEIWAKSSPETAGSLGSRSAKSDGWRTAVVVAEPPPAVGPAAQPSPAIAPLPGRMSIGGPVSAAPIAAAPIAAIETPTSNSDGSDAAQRRIPQHVVGSDQRPRPRRARSYGGGTGYASKPVKTSKAARIRAMHYNLFSRPDRTTN